MLSKRIVIIVIYFGNLNRYGYFKQYLKSCEENSYVDWLLFCDDKTKYSYPSNFHIHYLTFNDIKDIIQSKYNFQIVLDSPYKLCDFKPAYGEIFEDYITHYDYWGYSDIDLIWGNISAFLTDELLESYEQLFTRGHLTIMANNSRMRELYRDKNGYEKYKKVFACCEHRAFDEDHSSGGYRDIVKRSTVKIYDPIIFADISKNNKFSLFGFELAQKELTQSEKYKKKSVFLKNIKGLYRFYIQKEEVQKEEYLYLHMQKRKLYNKLNENVSNYIVAPNYILKHMGDVNKFQCYIYNISLSNILYSFVIIKRKLVVIRIFPSILKRKLYMIKNSLYRKTCNK